jgi:hypothetical protein
LAVASNTTASEQLTWVAAQTAKLSRAEATWGEYDLLLAINGSYRETNPDGYPALHNG